MGRIFIGMAIVLALSACSAPEGAQRLTVSQSAGIGLAGTLISTERAQAGTRPVIHNPALQAAAQAHADDLFTRPGLSHTGSDGSSVMDRIARAGYSACYGAENIARGQPDIDVVIEDWTNSPGHYENLVNAQARHYGFARTGDVWVLVLARPC